MSARRASRIARPAWCATSAPTRRRRSSLAGGRASRRQHVAEAGVGLCRLGRWRACLRIDDARPARLVVEHDIQHTAGGAVLPDLGRLVPPDQAGLAQELADGAAVEPEDLCGMNGI